MPGGTARKRSDSRLPDVAASGLVTDLHFVSERSAFSAANFNAPVERRYSADGTSFCGISLRPALESRAGDSASAEDRNASSERVMKRSTRGCFRFGSRVNVSSRRRPRSANCLTRLICRPQSQTICDVGHGIIRVSAAPTTAVVVEGPIWYGNALSAAKNPETYVELSRQTSRPQASARSEEPRHLSV